MNALMIELSFLVQYKGPSKIYLETILQSIEQNAICNFDLPQYTQYLDARNSWGIVKSIGKHCLQPEKTNDYNPGGPIKAFYTYISNIESGTSQLLQRIQSQGSRLTIKQSQDFLPSFIKEILTAVDVFSTEAQKCVLSLIEIFITQTVGQEPGKPNDWARPLETAKKCQSDCDNCRSMNEFLRDPQRQNFTLPPRERFSYHLEGQFDYFRYFDVEEKVKDNLTAVTKTTKWWEEQHQSWEKRASDAIKTLQKLPQEELKACLGTKFDEIMDLRMVKINGEAEESNSGEKQCHEVKSTVPQKR